MRTKPQRTIGKILKDLKYKNDRIQGQLQVVLASADLTADDFDLLPELLSLHDPKEVDRMRVICEKHLNYKNIEWEDLSRPTETELSACFRGRLIRA